MSPSPTDNWYLAQGDECSSVTGVVVPGTYRPPPPRRAAATRVSQPKIIHRSTYLFYLSNPEIGEITGNSLQ